MSNNIEIEEEKNKQIKTFGLNSDSKRKKDYNHEM